MGLEGIGPVVLPLFAVSEVTKQPRTPRPCIVQSAIALRACLCIDLCMGTKTLSVDEEAYRILARAKRSARESFSQVIKRAIWDSNRPQCGALLDRVEGLPKMSERTLEALDAAQASDPPPESKWAR